jgi:hypothetical protein
MMENVTNRFTQGWNYSPAMIWRHFFPTDCLIDGIGVQNLPMHGRLSIA